MAVRLDAGLAAILSAALDAAVVVRPDGTIVGWNEAAERAFGWSCDEATGRVIEELIVPSRLRGKRRGLLHYLTIGEGSGAADGVVMETLHRDGHALLMAVSMARTDLLGEPVFLTFLRDIGERREAERQQALVIDELDHRMKNLLGVISSLARQAAQASSSLEDFVPSFLARLTSLGRAHEMLTRAIGGRASLHTLTETLVGAYGDIGSGRVSMTGPDVQLVPRQFLCLSMILHELMVNAIKYGALSTGEGTVELLWVLAGELTASEKETLLLEWIETSELRVEQPQQEGFGTRMIALNVRHGLRGRYSRQWRSDGLRFCLDFDLRDT